MALTDSAQPNVTIKVEEDQEASEVKGCYIWLSESTQPNLFDETGNSKRVDRVKRRRCSVANCDNYLYKNNPFSELRLISFHKFPKDEGTRAIWVELCNRSDKFSAKSSFICSVHFKPEDYVKNADHPLARRANRPGRLRPGAIPCLKLPEIHLKGVQSKNQSLEIMLDEQMESSQDEEDKDDDSDFAMTHSPRRNEDELIVSSEDEEEGYSDFFLSPRLSRNEENTQRSQGILKSSSKDLKEKRKRRLDLLKHKFSDLHYSFEKLKTETKEEIVRLNSILKNKEDEYTRELREVLSVFLKPEEVESVVEETVW